MKTFCENEVHIGVLGHIGNGNLGDESILSAVIENVKLRFPHARIVAISNNPKDTIERHGIEAFLSRMTPGRQSVMGHPKPPQSERGKNGCFTAKNDLPSQDLKNTLKKLRLVQQCRDAAGVLNMLASELRGIGYYIKVIRKIDLLIVSGSQQLIDYVDKGPWGQPFTLFKWTKLAMLFRRRIVFLSVGAGPLQTVLGKFFVKKALSVSQFNSFRDKTSCEWIEQLNLKQELKICPDLAFGNLAILKKYSGIASRPCGKSVGINLVPIYDEKYWVKGNDLRYKSYLEKLAQFSLWLATGGYSIHFFYTQINSGPALLRDMHQHINRLITGQAAKIFFKHPMRSVEDLVHTLSMFESIVASRYHACVLAYLLGKPVIGLAYGPKTFDLLEQFGQSEYALDLFEFEVEVLKRKFGLLSDNLVKEAGIISQRVSVCQDMLRRQYESAL